MLFIELILFNNNSGGNSQLKFLHEHLSKGHRKKTVILFSNSKINFRSFFNIFFDFINLYLSQKVSIIYSDPLLSFLEILPRSKRIIRYVQSIDEDLYDNHPKLSSFMQKFIKKYIRFNNNFGNNSIYVCSDYCANYISRYQRNYNFCKPTILFIKSKTNKKEIDSRSIVSIMSNPSLKGIDTLDKISKDFPDYKFSVITNKLISKRNYPFINFLNIKERIDLFKTLSNSLCHLSCSKKESLGLPIYEAMVAGIPSIFITNDSNQQLKDLKLLYFDSYRKETFEEYLKICTKKNLRNQIIKKQNKIIKSKFNIQISI